MVAQPAATSLDPLTGLVDAACEMTALEPTAEPMAARGMPPRPAPARVLVGSVGIPASMREVRIERVPPDGREEAVAHLARADEVATEQPQRRRTKREPSVLEIGAV